MGNEKNLFGNWFFSLVDYTKSNISQSIYSSHAVSF